MRRSVLCAILAIVPPIHVLGDRASAQQLPESKPKSRIEQLFEVQREMDQFSRELQGEHPSAGGLSNRDQPRIPKAVGGSFGALGEEEEPELDSSDLASFTEPNAESFGRLRENLPADSSSDLPSFLKEMRSDARLNDVFFLDTRHGWTAGDRGTIWRTDDGGRTWHAGHVPCSAPLYSIRFMDAENGIAVGGSVHPFTQTGHGVVLRTNDGGRQWYRVPEQFLPILHRVEMVSLSQGWAAGGASELYTGSVFTTENAGRRWEAIPNTTIGGWRTLDLLSPRFGAGVDEDGAVCVFRKTMQKARTPDLGWRRPTSIELISPEPPANRSGGVPINGWMVGPGGLVMNTRDAGMTWQTPEGELPGRSEAIFDFHALAVRGASVWLAGSPGTYIFHSPDAGRSWRALPSPMSTPIRDLTFVDSRNGFAVGDLGVILATRDGGRRWEVVRRGGRRLAVLGCYGRPEEVPIEVLVALCGEKGYLGGVAILASGPPSEKSAATPPPAQRLHEAVVEVGGVMAETTRRFPASDPALHLSADRLLAQFDRQNDGEGLLNFRRHLVRTLRTWRPEIVLGTDPDTNDGDALKKLIARELVMAVRAAADPSCFPEHLTEGGLETWQVKKVHYSLGNGMLGDINFSISEPAYHLQTTPAELGTLARGRYLSERKNVPETQGFITAVDEKPPIGRQKDFFSGIVLSPGGEARRRQNVVSEEAYARVEQRAKIRRNLHGILRFSTEGETSKGAVMMSQAGELIRGLDAKSAADVLAEMGWKCSQRGEWEAAHQAYALLLSRYPGHPLSHEAVRWLTRYLSSREVHRMRNRDQRYQVAGGSGGTHGVVTASVENARSDPWQVLLEEAAQYGKRLERRNLAVYLDPEIRFLLSVVQRKRGYPGDTKRYLIERSRRGDDAWARCAAAELWLLEPEKDALPIDRRECPKPILHAYYTPERPILDGRFDDDAWKKGQAVSLRHGSLLSDPTARRTRYRDPRGIPSSMNWNARRDIFRGQTPENDRPPSLLPDKVRNSPKPPSASPGPNTSVPSRTDPPPSPAESFPSAEDMLSGAIGSEPQLEDPYQTEVRFAYDHEFLYVAVRFRGGASEPLEESSRPRDPDLSNRDRVEIRLDLDRDYQTAYRFTLDRRGWGAESCWNTTSWNPTWYIARAEEGGFRRIEAAIPLEELADSFPQSRTVWALSLTRIVPGAGFRSWTEIDHLQETPDRYGYLLFH